MNVGARGLDDRHREQVGTLDDAEVGGGPGRLGQAAQRRLCGIAQVGLDLTCQAQDGQAEPTAPIGGAAYESVLLEGDDEAIDDGPTHPEGRRNLGDGQALGGIGQKRENP